MDVSILKGKILTSVVVAEDKESVRFFCNDGSSYIMHHHYSCCERVRIEDISGDIDDLVGSPIVFAEERTNRDNPPDVEYLESYTWTFYTFATMKGWVDIRWLGESNGNYSEAVDFEEIPPAEEPEQKPMTNKYNDAQVVYNRSKRRYEALDLKSAISEGLPMSLDQFCREDQHYSNLSEEIAFRHGWNMGMDGANEIHIERSTQ